MRLGEIKIQALELIFPSAELEYDAENLNEVLFNLRANPSFSSYLSASVGAINRALSVIEARQGEKTERITHLTPSSHELNLGCGLSEIIPYFVKSDLLLSESPSEAKDAREIFDKLLSEVLKQSGTYSETVYSQREL